MPFRKKCRWCGPFPGFPPATISRYFREPSISPMTPALVKWRWNRLNGKNNALIRLVLAGDARATFPVGEGFDEQQKTASPFGETVFLISYSSCR